MNPPHVESVKPGKSPTSRRLRVMGANWKLHKDPAGTKSFFERFRLLVEDFGVCEIVICPSFLDIPTAVSASEGTPIHVGAQNLYWEKEGAFTGEVSGPMIKASGCSHVIVGHSERRRFFGETDASVLKKTIAALDAGLTPIVCIGEREKKNVEAVLREQFDNGIAPLSAYRFAKIIIAYEPIWAIGAGETATPEVAGAAHRVIRAQVEERFGTAAADQVRVIYGGSVKPDNAGSLMAQSEIDGFLVGGASLDAVSFATLVNLRKAEDDLQSTRKRGQSMSRTTVGLFENASVAEQVVHDLGANAVPRSDIRVLQEPLDMPVTGAMSLPHTDFQVRLELELKAIGATATEANAYAQGVSRGGVLVFATGSNKQVDSASEIMNRHGAMEVEELTGNAPNLAGVMDSGVPLAYVGSTSQTGRSRQSGGGARMFVW